MIQNSMTIRNTRLNLKEYAMNVLSTSETYVKNETRQLEMERIVTINSIKSIRRSKKTLENTKKKKAIKFLKLLKIVQMYRR